MLGFGNALACCDCRKSERQIKTANNPEQPKLETVGVGMVLKPSFQSDTFLALVVHSLVPGSSAELSGHIQAGDILHSIDEADVYRKPANEVAKRLLGRPGTTVRLGLLRLVSEDRLAPGAEGGMRPFPESLVTSEGTYEQVVVALERKRIPQQSPRSLSSRNSPYTTPRQGNSSHITPRNHPTALNAPTPSPF